MVDNNEKDNGKDHISHELLGKIMDQLDIGVTISNPNIKDNPLVYVNEGFSKVTGYTPSEVIGRNCRFLQGEQTDRAIVQEMSKRIKNEEVFATDILNYKKDGQKFWNELNVFPIRDDEKGLQYFVGIQKDITDRKVAEEINEANLLFARTIQRGLLPNSFEDSNLSITGYYDSCDQLSGDFYYWQQIGDGLYSVILIDVVGHGVSSSLVNMLLRSLLSEGGMKLDPEAFPKVFNNYMNKFFSNLTETVYFTCMYLQINTKLHSIKYVNCGHPAAVYLDSKLNIQTLEKGTLPIGIFPEIPTAIESGKIEYTPNSRLLLFSDGLFTNEGCY